jgi:hypothetical protein
LGTKDVAQKGQKPNPFFAFALSGRLVCISFTQGVALGYYLVAPLGRFDELRIIIQIITKVAGQ